MNVRRLLPLSVVPGMVLAAALIILASPPRQQSPPHLTVAIPEDWDTHNDVVSSPEIYSSNRFFSVQLFTESSGPSNCLDLDAALSVACGRVRTTPIVRLNTGPCIPDSVLIVDTIYKRTTTLEGASKPMELYGSTTSVQPCIPGAGIETDPVPVAAKDVTHVDVRQARIVLRDTATFPEGQLK